MEYKKIVIIYNARIPNEKANGYQTFKTAEALILNKQKVEIWAPRRFNIKNLSKVNLKEYYSLSSSPEVIKIKVIDLLSFISVDNFISKYLKFFSSQLITLTFSLGVLIRIILSNNKNLIYFTRDVNLAFILISLYPSIKSKIFIELHNLPSMKYRKKRYFKILKKCKGLIVLTKFMQNELIRNNINSNNILYAPDAVDVNQFKVNISKLDARRILSLPNDIKIFLYIGKFHTLGNEKGIPEIIKALKFLKISNKYKLYIVGGPLDRVNKYEEIIKQNQIDPNQIKFYDRQEINKIPLWLKSADILLMPHPKGEFYEKYVSPLKLFEYMTAKKPIIASNLKAIREILIHKKNSYLVEAGSPESISNAIKFLVENNDLAQKISRQAYDDVNNYSWLKRSKSIQKFINVKISSIR